MKRIIPLLLFVTLLLAGCGADETHWQVSSPDNRLIVSFQLDKEQGGVLSYSAMYDGKEALATSPLGIERKDTDFSKGLNFVSSETKSFTEEYTMVTGKRLHNKVNGNETAVLFENADGKALEVIFRAFNDGFAFRYSFPQRSDDVHTILSEATGFQVPLDGKAWIQPYDTLGTWAPGYEYGYLDGIEIGSPDPIGTGWGFPALFNTNGLWMLITETGLDESYVGSHLAPNPEGGLYKIQFPWMWESYGQGYNTAKTSLPAKTPWRLVILGDSQGDILESNLVNTLAEPSRLQETDWIKPGISSWSWWGDHSSGRNYQVLKEYVDFAAEMGWAYSLVDADWHIMEGGTLEELAEYAATKDVGLLIWYNSGGPHTRVMNAGPRNLMHERETRRKEFKRIADMGIKGIKVDFFQSGKQPIIQLYIDIFMDAADFGLIVNTHGCTIPRGWNRTFPNVVTMEAVRGGELYSWEGFPPEAVYLNNIYPYTRNVQGSMDYTPVIFDDYATGHEHWTSFGHELALAVVFESGIQHFADRKESYLRQPFYVLDFLKEVPVVWDDTWYVDGYPGSSAVIARKKGDDYWIGGISGVEEPEQFSFVPEFLGEGTYVFELLRDGENPASFEIETREVTAADSIHVDAWAYGGFAGTFKKK